MTFVLFLFFVIVCIALYIRQRDIAIAAFYSGYRKGVKDSVDVIKQEADTTLEKAPEGRLVEALSKASILGDVKHKVRELSFRIGTPVD
jgi:hypothetical protein